MISVTLICKLYIAQFIVFLGSVWDSFILLKLKFFVKSTIDKGKS